MTCNGRIEWTLKQSLLSYIRALGSVQGTASTDSSEIFTFPHSADASSASRWAFSGSVILNAHHGLLDVQLFDPHIELGESSSVLSFALPSGSRITFADVALRGDEFPAATHSRATFEAEMSAQGARLFDGRYSPGESLDPITFDFSVA